MRRGKRNRSIVIYAAVTLFTLVFGQVYEYFGFGVTSPFMHFAFLIPLLLGLLPCMLMRVSGKADVFSKTPRAWWRLGIATLMAGSVFRGVLDIYGTESPLLYAYPAAGTICLAAALFLAASPYDV